jgi:nitroreductase
MEALAAILSRHSVPPAFLAEPAPEGAALDQILAAGAAAPDHGRLRPWRFLVIRGAARARLGEVLAAALARRNPAATAEAIEQERQRPLRTPLLVAVIATIDPAHAKIPLVEQLLATGAAVQNMLLAAHALGFGAKWLTGPAAYDDTVKAALGLGADDQLAAFVHIGTIAGAPPAVPHAAAAELSREWSGPA